MLGPGAHQRFGLLVKPDRDVGRSVRISCRAIRVSGSERAAPECSGSPWTPSGRQSVAKLRFRSTPRLLRRVPGETVGVEVADRDQAIAGRRKPRSDFASAPIPAHSSPWMQPIASTRGPPRFVPLFGTPFCALARIGLPALECPIVSVAFRSTGRRGATARSSSARAPDDAVGAAVRGLRRPRRRGRPAPARQARGRSADRLALPVTVAVGLGPIRVGAVVLGRDESLELFLAGHRAASPPHRDRAADEQQHPGAERRPRRPAVVGRCGRGGGLGLADLEVREVHKGDRAAAIDDREARPVDARLEAEPPRPRWSASGSRSMQTAVPRLVSSAWMNAGWSRSAGS